MPDERKKTKTSERPGTVGVPLASTAGASVSSSSHSCTVGSGALNDDRCRKALNGEHARDHIAARRATVADVPVIMTPDARRVRFGETSSPNGGGGNGEGDGGVDAR